MERKRFFFIAVLAFLFSGFAVFSADRISIEKPFIDEDAGSVGEFNTIIKHSSLLAGKIYSRYFRIDYPGSGQGDYLVNLVLTGSGDDTTVSITMKDRETGNQQSFAVIGPLSEDRVVHFAKLYFYLWSSFQGFLAGNMAEPPSLVDQLSSDYVSQSIITGVPMQLFPYTAAVKENGNFLVAFIYRCVEFDRNFRIVGQIGEALGDSGNYTFAYGVYTTPGGTVYLKPSAGREVYKFIEGAPRHIKVKTGMEVTGPFVALPDGSIVTIDLTKKTAVRQIGRKRVPLDLFPGQYSYISAAACGPEGNIWVYDITERRILIYAPDGTFLDTIIPAVSQETPLSPFSMAVYPDGSFVLFSNGEMRRFRRDGSPVWQMTETDFPIPESLPMNGGIALDGERGLIYLVDMMGRRIMKFLDNSYVRENNLKDTPEDKILDINSLIIQDPESISLMEEKAKFYENYGAYEMASAYWEGVLDLDPFHEKAGLRLDEIEILTLKAKARAMKKKTIELLESLGPESARDSYSSAVQFYEKIFSINPMEQESRKEFESLKEQYLEKSAVPKDMKQALTVVSAEIEDLFPSLIYFYRNNPAGSVRIRNKGNQPVSSLKASLYIRKFMDFPSEIRITRNLSPGEEINVPLSVLFNDAVFQLQEDLPVQSRIEVSGMSGGAEISTSISKTLVLHRRTALTWDRTEKLASYIMPNEGIITAFSHRVLSGDGPGHQEGLNAGAGLPPKMRDAARICDALGVYNIHYTEDPDSPISKILGKAAVLDTIRFPRTTLSIKSGDCDDTTALLASLLESSGIDTAIMTSPGHVFLAFNSEEPAGSKWLFDQGGFTSLPHEGSLWLPVETTVLQKGFITAWASASGLVRKHAGEKSIEFLPVKDLRAEYPPLPIGESTMTILEPPEDEIGPFHAASLASVQEAVYTGGLGFLEEKLRESDRNRVLKIENKIGILHARFGDPREAEEIFRDLIDKDPGFTAPYINLANLLNSAGKTGEAVTLLEKGLNFNPDSPLMNLLLARGYYTLEKNEETEKYYTRVRDVSPDLAARFSYLGESAQAGSRAGTGEDLEHLLWDSGN